MNAHETTRCQFSHFICVSLSDSSSFSLFSRSVVEHCALQEHLKEEAEEPVQGEVMNVGKV